MSPKIYDIAIIGAWAAGMFAGIHAPKDLDIIILEKNNKIGTKVLMSWGERCNVSNIDIEPERDYFGRNTKCLYGIFKKFSNYDMISWLEDRGVRTQIEDRGRIILASGRAVELVAILEQELKKNDVQIVCNSPALQIEKKGDIFEIHTPQGILCSKNIILSSGGKSFASVGTDGWGYKIAEQFGHTQNEPFKWLCGIVTREDLSEISGSTIFVNISLLDGEKEIYSEFDGSFLFTHFWVSGPMIYNAVVRLGEYLREQGISSEQEALYVKDRITLKISFSETSMTKKVEKFFGLSPEDMERVLHINDMRSWSEAKVTGGWVLVDELDKNFQSKIVPGLYMIGEVIDITGKTGGFNLQSAWSEGYIVGKSL
jgi:predicted Rossmann fold flavoprotein